MENIHGGGGVCVFAAALGRRYCICRPLQRGYSGDAIHCCGYGRIRLETLCAGGRKYRGCAHIGRGYAQFTSFDAKTSNRDCAGALHHRILHRSEFSGYCGRRGRIQLRYGDRHLHYVRAG